MAFVQEALIMKDFRHAHVLGLLGLSEARPGVPYVILPFVENGDLHTYVKDPKIVSQSTLIQHLKNGVY